MRRECPDCELVWWHGHSLAEHREDKLCAARQFGRGVAEDGLAIFHGGKQGILDRVGLYHERVWIAEENGTYERRVKQASVCAAWIVPILHAAAVTTGVRERVLRYLRDADENTRNAACVLASTAPERLEDILSWETQRQDK